jgi:hypothetical protein
MIEGTYQDAGMPDRAAAFRQELDARRRPRRLWPFAPL